MRVRLRPTTAILALAVALGGCAGGARLPTYDLQPPEVIERVDDGYAPWIKIHSGTFAVEKPQLNHAVWYLGAQKHKKSGKEEYFIHLSLIYTANEPHEGYKARLRDGTQLSTRPPERTVSSCISDSKTCVYNDQLQIEVPVGTLKTFVQSDLVFEFQFMANDKHSLSIPAVVVSNLIKRARLEAFQI